MPRLSWHMCACYLNAASLPPKATTAGMLNKIQDPCKLAMWGGCSHAGQHHYFALYDSGQRMLLRGGKAHQKVMKTLGTCRKEVTGHMQHDRHRWCSGHASQKAAASMPSLADSGVLQAAAAA